MNVTHILCTKRSRRAALALLAGAAMSGPAAVAADEVYRLRAYETTYAVPFAMNLELTIAANGSARVQGTIRLGPQRDSASRTLVALRTGQARLADADGDGVSGLVRLEADFRDVASGARVSVLLVPTGSDIDASGDYEVAIVIGEESLTGLIAAHIGTARRGRRR